MDVDILVSKFDKLMKQKQKQTIITKKSKKLISNISIENILCQFDKMRISDTMVRSKCKYNLRTLATKNYKH